MKQPNRYICIHGHFYQPPRENAWLETIEVQDEARPYHDWNERITAECYASNATARILDNGLLEQIFNNYSHISFDFGPTLLSWMEKNVPETYGVIIDSDRESRKAFAGHGSAMAHCYNHIIMPLANYRDKYTQVFWGLKDFEHRFGRPPEGMWLPETAVDLETLEIMAELGIKFTILAPHQARHVRQIGTTAWQDVNNSLIDPTMAYELNLPSGKKIDLFFYHGALAHAVAFGGLLSSGMNFANSLVSAFSETASTPQLVHIATDGETYGHHHRFGEMALAYALHYIENNKLARITNYGAYLEECPPTYEVEIIEETSWSCSHGVERWRSDCGDTAGGHPTWNQAWRAPLREALDWLRDTVAPKYKEKAQQYLKDPWAARNDYIKVILDRSPAKIEEFLARNSLRQLDGDEKITVLKLLELQRFSLLSHSSCGWFFDDISRIEPKQIIQYAGRAIQLYQELFPDNIKTRFLGLLGKAKSNIPEFGDGQRIYESVLRPARFDMTRVAAHHAVDSVFQEERKGQQSKFYTYRIETENGNTFQSGSARLAMGRIKIISDVTQEAGVRTFGALYAGDHDVYAGVGSYEEGRLEAIGRELIAAFSAQEFGRVHELIDKYFSDSTFSLKSLFKDEQSRVLDQILERASSEVEANCRQIYEHHYSLMRLLTDLNRPLPDGFQSAAEATINANLRQAFTEEKMVPERVKELLDEAAFWKVKLDNAELELLMRQRLHKMAGDFASSPGDIHLLDDFLSAVELAKTLPFFVNLDTVQNRYFELAQTIYPRFKGKAEKRDRKARVWVEKFDLLGKQLWIKLPVLRS